MEKPEPKDKGKRKAVDDHDQTSPSKKRLDEVSKLTHTDVLTYERSVQIAFKNQLEKYTLFNEILDGFTGDKISGDEVIKKMNILLQGHEELLVGLKRFLCSYYRLKTGVRHAYPLNSVDADNFVSKVKEHFGCNSTKYNTFVGILKSYQNNNSSSAEVYSMGVRLFEDEPNLFQDFKKFVPPKFQS